MPEKISGVLVANISAKSPYAPIMRSNTIIMEVNGQSVSEPKDVDKYVDKEKANRFYIWYNGRVRYLVIRF